MVSAAQLGANTVTGVAAKFGLQRPFSVRDMVNTYGSPLQPTNLRINWSGADHPPNSTNVPIRAGLVVFEWDDPGIGTVREAACILHFQFKGTSLDAGRVKSPTQFQGNIGVNNIDYNTAYSWQLTPVNEFGQGPSSPAFTFVTEAEPAPPPPPPPPPPQHPVISVASSGTGQQSVFTVTGSGFSPNKDVRIRVVDDALNERDFHQSADGSGKLNARLGMGCNSGGTLHFSATDGRADHSDLTGVLWSNTFNIPCP